MKSNKSRKVLLGTAVLAAVGLQANYAGAASDDVAISARIIAPIAITATTTLKFGSATETGAGTIVVQPGGAGSTTGGVSIVGADLQAGGFKVVAALGAVYDVTAPTKVSITETAGGVAKMTVNNFRYGTAAGAAFPLTDTVTGGTANTYGLGATLNVGAGQTQGLYAGVVTLTANYQ